MDGCRQPQAQEQNRQLNSFALVQQVLRLGVGGWQHSRKISFGSFLQGDPSARVTLLLEDTFGRMLAHGLAQFHGLMSVTCKEAQGGTAVLVHFRPSRQAGDADAVVGLPEITW